MVSRISVIMPARNAAATIEESARSVLQSARLGELLVIDDQSTDATASIASGIGDPRIRIVSGEARGISAALNIGLRQASGDLIARCDADDLYPADRLEWQCDWLAENPAYIAVTGGFRTVTADGRTIADLACAGEPCDVSANLLGGEPHTHFCAWLTRRSALEAVAGAREWFVTAEDLDLMFRLAAVGPIWHVPRIAYAYRLHDHSIVHTQPNILRVFYEQSACAFALERAAGRPDPLAQGNPPLIPDADPACNGAGVVSAAKQAAGQLEGVAWYQFSEGEHRKALASMWLAVRMNPTDLQKWCQLVRLGGKSLITIVWRQKR